MKRFYFPRLVVLAVALGCSISAIAQTTARFDYTGSVQTYTVPAGITSVEVRVAGAQGGDDNYGGFIAGPLGGLVTARLAVTAGDVLNIYVGGRGPNNPTLVGGFNGGGGGAPAGGGAGGGGASDIRRGGVALANRIIVAGGGAGAGDGGFGGGQGGGLTGATGISEYTTGAFAGSQNAIGGSQLSGGAGGTYMLFGSLIATAGSGSLGVGGNGNTTFGLNYGGGGGGGYYGGGGNVYGNGGGGSSYTDPVLATNVVHTQGANAGNGYVLICVAPIISNLSSVVGNPASTMTITGTDFNSTTTNNFVYFGATKATVNTATSNSLNVTVPNGGIFSPVTVNNNTCALTGYSKKPFLPSYSGTGSVTFNPNVNFAANNHPSLVVIGDIDGDGKPDLVVVTSANSISIYRNVSSSGVINPASFPAKVDFAGLAFNFNALALSDVDGDGKLDIVVGNFGGSSSVSIFRNTATSGIINSGSLAPRVDVGAVGGNISSVAVGDIDADGKPDIVTTDLGGFVHIFKNNATLGTITSGSFAAAVNLSAFGNTWGLAIADMDGDGKPDIVVGHDGGPTQISVFRNNGSAGVIDGGTFSARVDFPTGGNNPVSLVVGDIDGDGKLDIIVGNYAASTISILQNTATSGVINSGSFATNVNFPCGANPFYMAIGDITGDGKPDIIAADFGGNGVSIYKNTSTIGTINALSLAAHVYIATGSGPWGVAVGDLDGDGAPDIVVNNAFDNNLTILRNNPPVNNPPTFTGGSPQSFTVCQNSSANSINALLTINDIDVGNTETWTVTAGPTNGTIATGGTQSSTGGNVTPTGFSYTPTGGYTGTDAFTIQVSDGAGGTATTVINVTVNATPTAAFTVSTNPVCANVPTTFNSSSPLCSRNALSFNGSSSNATMASVITTAQNNITAEAWVNWSGGTASNQFIIYNGNSGPNGYGLMVPSGGSGTLEILAGGITFMVSTATLTTGVWNHVAMVRNAGTWSVYLNGTQFTVTSSGTTPNVPAGNFRVGNTQTGVEGFNGTIDEVKFWNVVRSTAQIQADMNACYVAQQAGLLGNWQFNEGSGITTADASGNNNTLNLTGTTWVAATEALSTYAWSFGDATTSTINPIAHTYTAGATYTPTLTVTNSNGCTASATATVTVNPAPAAIGGAGNVCTGATLNLTDGTPGGTWSSSNPALANVGSSTGVVTGFSPGTPSIIYTLTGTGCTASATVTVNQSPTGISGSTFSVCVGSNITLTNGYAGGIWTSSIPAQASVGTGNGIVNGLAPGTPIITYTMPGSCTSSQQVTVNANPGAIGGANTVCVGLQTTLTDGTPSGVWSSSAGAVATIGAGTGTVTGISGGNTTISYTLATGCFATKPFTVNPLPATITGTMNVCVGLNTTLSDATPGGNWSSSNGAQATVGTSGIVTGVAPGTPTITYTLPATGCINTTVVTVNPNPAIITGTNNVCVGLTVNLNDVTGTGSWSSGTPALATIGSLTGVVTGISQGNPIMTYSLATGCIASFPMTVNPLPAAIGGVLQACPGTATNLTDGSVGGTWSSSNTAVATVGTSGTVTGVSTGTTTITYTLPTGCITTAQVTINPNPAAITGLSTVCQGSTTNLADGTGGGSWTSSLPGNASVGGGTGIVTGLVGSTTTTITYTLPTGCLANFPMTVNPLPAVIGGATNVCVGLTANVTDGSGASTWSSSNTALATVGSGTGVVTGVAAGTLTITFTLPTGCMQTAPFTVNPTPAAIAGTTNVCVGSTRTLTDATSGGTWSSSNIALATVGSSTGVVSGLSAGSGFNIIYTLPAGCTATAPFTVNPTPVAIGGTFTVCTGATTSLNDGTPLGTWSSSNTALATVGGTGIVTGVSAGTPVITYTTNPGSCFAIQAVTVNTTPSANTGTASVCVGQTTTLSNGTGGGAWSTSNGAQAGVGTGTGVVNGVAPGNPVITYTLGTGCFASTTVTVNNSPGSFTGSSTVCTGATTPLSNTVIGGTWSSSNTAVATVGGTGIVSGVSAGTVNITYTLNPGSCIAIFPMTVNQTPPAIVGAPNICIGVPVTFSDGIGGGNWTSSNPGLASVGSSTGIVTGLATGNLNIVYTLPAGCFATFPVTVNTQPGAITGANNVCVGQTTTLTDAGGGTWTSSNTVLATIGSSSGTVSGLSAGSLTITYTLAGGCTSLLPFTVNPTPAGITGTAVACVNATSTLFDATFGGTWSSSNPALATVGSSSGIVTGLAAGNPNIIYTLPAGCTASVVFTVNALPGLNIVTGGGAYCAGLTGVAINLSGSTNGVNYQLFNGPTPSGAAVPGSGGGITFGLRTAAGTYTVVGTNTTTGCTNTMTGSAVITINPTPTIYNITGGGSLCTGGSPVHIGLSLTDAFGVTYKLFNSVPTLVAGPLSGIGVPLDFGTFSAAGTYTATATITATGCTSNMNGSAVITVNPLPTLRTVTGGGAYCTGGTGVHIGVAAPTDIGINYQLMLLGSPVGSPLPGTLAAIDFGLITGAGVYTVQATNVTTGCINTMTGSATVTINVLPTAFTITGGGGYCIGGTGVPMGLSNSTIGVNYQLQIGGVNTGGLVAGTGIPLVFPLQTAAGVYTVAANNPTTTCNNNMLGSVTVTINPLPTLFTVTGGGSYCTGGTGVHVGLSGSTPGTSYQLMNGVLLVGLPIIGTGSALDFGSLTTAATYTVKATNPTTCFVLMTGSATVSTTALPLQFTVGGGGAYCVGGLGFAITLSGSTLTTVSYQLFNGTTAVGTAVTGTGGLLNFGLQTAAGTYTVKATIIATGCTATMLGSAVITINPLPPLFTVTGGGSFCAGGTGPSIGLSGSTSGVNYQLFRGVTPLGTVGGSGGAITFGPQTTAGSYTVVATYPLTTCTLNMTGSAVIIVNPVPNVYTVTGGGGYCIGGLGVHVGLSSSNIGINYQLKVGVTLVGLPVPGTGAALDFGLQPTVGTYTVVATDAVTGCTSNMTGSVNVSTNVLPTVFNVTGTNSYCAGGIGVPVTLSGSTVGVNYQLYNGITAVGAPVSGTGIGTLNMGLQTVAGTYTVVATNPLTTCTSNMTGSAVVTINPLPNTFVVTGGGGYCIGGTGVHIGLNNSNLNISYQLFNPAPVLPAVAGTGSAIDFGAKTVAGTYTAIATNTITGCTRAMIGSAAVSINPLPGLFTVSVAGTGHYCIGGSGVHVLQSGSAVGINYQLFNGATPFGAPMVGTSFLLDFGLQTAAGTYTVVATDAVTGCTRTMTASATITIDPLPTPFAVLGGGSFCPGGTGVDIQLGNSTSGTSYQLFNGVTTIGGAVGGFTGSPIDFGLQPAIGTYTVVAHTISTGCNNNMTGSAIVSYNPVPPVHTVSGGGSYCAGGTGVNVILNGSDMGINYQLHDVVGTVGGPVAGTGLALNFGLQTVAGSYTVVASNVTTSCVDTMFDSAEVVINPLPALHTITGGGSYCPGTSGVNISLNGSEIGINYQLFNGATPVGAPMAGTGFGLSYGLFTAPGVYTITAENISTFCVNNMLGTDTITINSIPVAYLVTGGGSYCAGGTGLNIGLGSSNTGITYQLYNGITPVGGPVTGTGFALNFGLHTAAGVYTVTAYNVTTGCTNNMSGSATININPLPTAYIMTGGGGYCAGGAGVHIGLSGSNVGITYRLYNGVTLVGSPVGGTGVPLDFGIHSDTGTYTVVATNTVTGCVNNMSGSTVVSINPLPVVFVVSGSGTGYCAGGTGVIIYLSGSQLGVSYQLYRGALPIGTALAGTGTALDYGLQTVPGVYTVVAVNTTTICSSNMAGSATITINPLPTIYTVSGGGNYCPGGAGVHIGLTGSNTGIKYQLFISSIPTGSPVNGTGLPLDFGLKTATGTYTVVATNAVTGCVNNMSGSTTVGINPLPIVYTLTGGGTYCIGGIGVTIGLSGSVAGTNYQLYHNSLPIGGLIAGTGTPLNFGLQTATGSYTVVAIDAVSTCTINMSGSAIVATNSLPNVFALTGGGNYCPGGTGVNVGLSGSDVGINYQLYVGGVPTGSPMAGTGAALSFGLQTATSTYTVVATNATTSCTKNMSGSAVVGLNPLPFAYTVMGGGGYCDGSAGVHIGLSGSAVGFSYQVYNGGPYGSPVFGTGSLLDFGVFTDTGTYTVIARNNITTCVSNMAGSAIVTVNPVVTAGVSIISGAGDSVCSGTLTTFTGLAVNGGTSPAYQWTVNGINTSTGSTYSYIPANGDIVKVSMESSAPCVINPIVNNSMMMTVIPKAMPMVSIAATPGDVVCKNTLVTFTATPAYGGSLPAYQWKKNGANAGTSSPTYSYVPNDSDVVYCMMTSNYYCPIANTVSSNHISIEVDTQVVPVVTITANPGVNIALGQTVQLTATVTTGGGPNPTYQWLVNGIPVPGAIFPTYTSNEFTNLSVVRCDVLSSGGCSGVLGTSSITMHVKNVGVTQITTTGSDIKLVPNPNKGTFTVKGTLGTIADQEVSFEITNMIGQVIYKDNIIARNGEINEKIQLSNSLANGMYILNLRSGAENKVFHIVIEQ